MLLFHKRTKKIIKYAWGFISILIVLSMVVTYSGFTMLARTAATPTDQVPVPLQDTEQLDATTDMQTVIDAANASNTLELRPADQATEPAPAPVPQLDFSL